MDCCKELPDAVRMSDYGGQWEEYKEALYTIFQKDMVDGKPLFQGKPVFIFRETLFDGKERSFWHVISAGKNGDENRFPDMKRCESIAWIKPLIQEDGSCAHHKVWAKHHDRSKRSRWYIWCDKIDYVVILEERGRTFCLITAFCVVYSSTKKTFYREYALYQKTKAPIGE